MIISSQDFQYKTTWREAIVQFQFSVGDKVKFRSKIVFEISVFINCSFKFCLSVYIAVFIIHQILCTICEFCVLFLLCKYHYK